MWEYVGWWLVFMVIAWMFMSIFRIEIVDRIALLIGWTLIYIPILVFIALRRGLHRR